MFGNKNENWLIVGLGNPGKEYERIEESPIKEMVFLNTIPEVANTASGKLKFLDVAPVFARAIEHIHGATSIADLF